MDVSAQSLASAVLHWCPFVTPHQRLNSLPFPLCVYLFLLVSLPLPSLLFSSSFTHTPTPEMPETVEVLIGAIGKPDLVYSQH